MLINEHIKSNRSLEMELQYFIKQIFGDDDDRKFHLNYSAFIFLKNTKYWIVVLQNGSRNNALNNLFFILLQKR